MKAFLLLRRLLFSRSPVLSVHRVVNEAAQKVDLVAGQPVRTVKFKVGKAVAVDLKRPIC